MRENQFSKVKNRLLELKGRDIKIKRDIEELSFKPIIVPIDHMDKFEEK